MHVMLSYEVEMDSWVEHNHIRDVSLKFCELEEEQTVIPPCLPCGIVGLCIAPKPFIATGALANTRQCNQSMHGHH